MFNFVRYDNVASDLLHFGSNAELKCNDYGKGNPIYCPQSRSKF